MAKKWPASPANNIEQGTARSTLPPRLQSGMKITGLLATRRSLVDRLGNWDDHSRWQEFFDTYWKLIYSVARKAGLNDAEAQDVVQETVITVAKNVGKLSYDPAAGSFKGWLLNITRWRIADQFRKRLPIHNSAARLSDDRRTVTIERVADSNAVNLDELWEREWHENLLATAMTRLKKKVAPKHFQIFDCSVRKEWPVQKIADTLAVSVGQVYLVRHRVAALLKKEIKVLERAGT
jgi:RNA polymerase sigma-70 factor (ECF subfamily)